MMMPRNAINIPAARLYPMETKKDDPMDDVFRTLDKLDSEEKALI